MKRTNVQSTMMRVSLRLYNAVEQFANDRKWTFPVATDELAKDITVLIPYLTENKEQVS